MNIAAPMDVEKMLMAVSGGMGDCAGSHDHADIEDNTAQAQPHEEYDEGLQVHCVGKGGGAGW